MRGRFLLTIVGLLLFAGTTNDSLRVNREAKNATGRYFWWSSLRLDADPLSKRSPPGCKDVRTGCNGWSPVIWVDPGWLTKALILLALPAFLIGTTVAVGLGRLGMSEVSTFLISMPLLIAAWCYLVGWLFDRWTSKSPSH